MLGLGLTSLPTN